MHSHCASEPAKRIANVDTDDHCFYCGACASIAMTTRRRRKTKKKETNFHRHEVGIVFSPPPSLRASCARINRNMWSAGARLCCIVSFVLFFFLLIFFFSFMMQQRSLQNGKWCLLWSSDTAYHSVLCLAAAVFIYFLYSPFVSISCAVWVSVLRRTFFICRSRRRWISFFSSTSDYSPCCLSLLESRASSRLQLVHHSVQILCPSDIDGAPLCDCLSRRFWIVIVLRIIVNQVIERSNRSKQLPTECCAGRNAEHRESREKKMKL